MGVMPSQTGIIRRKKSPVQGNSRAFISFREEGGRITEDPPLTTMGMNTFEIYSIPRDFQ
jgi:hypothetical protein